MVSCTQTVVRFENIRDRQESPNIGCVPEAMSSWVGNYRNDQRSFLEIRVPNFPI